MLAHEALVATQLGRRENLLHLADRWSHARVPQPLLQQAQFNLLQRGVLWIIEKSIRLHP